MNTEKTFISEQELFQKIAEGDRFAEEELLLRFKTIEKIDLMVRTRADVSYEIQDNLIRKILSEIILSLRLQMCGSNRNSFNAFIYQITKNILSEILTGLSNSFKDRVYKK